MTTITEEQVATFLSTYDALTADFLCLDYKAVSDFITPDTDLYLLTLLAKAEKQGLDLVFVDKAKFFTASYRAKPVKLLKEPIPWEGSCFADIDLSFIMHDSYSFTYRGILEPMGLDIDLNTLTMIGESVTYFEQKDDLEWMDGQVRTVADMVTYLNEGLRSVKPPETFKSRFNDFKRKVQNSFIYIILYGLFIWIPRQIIYWIIKRLIRVYTFLKELIEDQNKPLGYRREK